MACVHYCICAAYVCITEKTDAICTVLNVKSMRQQQQLTEPVLTSCSKNLSSRVLSPGLLPDSSNKIRYSCKINKSMQLTQTHTSAPWSDTCHVAQLCYSIIGDKPFLWSKATFDPP